MQNDLSEQEVTDPVLVVVPVDTDDSVPEEEVLGRVVDPKEVRLDEVPEEIEDSTEGLIVEEVLPVGT